MTGACILMQHFFVQIPEVDVAIHSVSIDPDAAYLAAVNSKVMVVYFNQNTICNIICNRCSCRAHVLCGVCLVE